MGQFAELFEGDYIRAPIIRRAIGDGDPGQQIVHQSVQLNDCFLF
jgi:hypothetical protein